MARIILPRVKPGDEITAGLFNAFLDAAERAQLSLDDSGALLGEFTPHGGSITDRILRPIWAQITANNGSGSYGFTEQYPTSGGGWTAGALTGTCYEFNGNAGVAINTYVPLRPTLAGDWRFYLRAC